MRAELCVIGCGDTFDDIVAGHAAIDATRLWHFIRLDSTDEIQRGAEQKVAHLATSTVRVFAAVGAAALNHARFELYGKLRLLGYVGDTLIHPRAIVDPAAHLGENCWVGPLAQIGPGCRIAANTFIGAGARLDADVRVGMSAWIGAGSSLGRGAEIGTHSVIGNDARVARGVAVGRHCLLESPADYRDAVADATFIHPDFPGTVRVYSPPPARRAPGRRA